MISTRKKDPTNTQAIRKAYKHAFQKALLSIANQVTDLIVKEDVFGLEKRLALFNTRWKFVTEAQKVLEFKRWFRSQLRSDVEGEGEVASHWANKFIRHTYEKAVGRSYDDVQKIAKKQGTTLEKLTKSDFLRSVMAERKTLDALEVLFQRNLTTLEGFTQDMSTKAVRILADGLARNRSAKKIAAELTKAIRDLSKTRALTIVNTELSFAYAEAQLNALERLGVTKLGVMAEWITAKDSHVCPRCQPLEGLIVPISKARGLIPRHPNCRCAWIPAEEKNAKQIRTKRDRKRAIGKSVREETRERSTKKAIKRSKWIGADLLNNRRKGYMPMSKTKRTLKQRLKNAGRLRATKKKKSESEVVENARAPITRPATAESIV